MPHTIYDSARRQALAERLDRLSASTSPRWGRMDASRMVCHLLEAFRMPAGELRIPRRFVPFRALMRWLMLYVLRTVRTFVRRFSRRRSPHPAPRSGIIPSLARCPCAIGAS